MFDHSSLMLRSLLGVGENWADGLSGSARRLRRQLHPIRAAVQTSGLSVPWKELQSDIHQAIFNVLNMNFFDVVLKAWTQVRSIEEYKNVEKHGPDKLFMVPLGEHTIRTTQRPALEIYMEEQLIRRLVLEITISLKLKGFIVHIRGGRVFGVRTGSLQGRGLLAVEGVVVLDKTFKEYRLPGFLEFGGTELMPVATSKPYSEVSVASGGAGMALPKAEKAGGAKTVPSAA